MERTNLNIRHEILSAICKKSFLYVRYTHPHTDKKDTFFWIGIDNLNVKNNNVYCFGYNIDTNKSSQFDKPISIDRIKEAKVVDETYYCSESSEKLLHDIKTSPETYEPLFGDYTENLNILDYYEECIRLNNTPFLSDDKFTKIDKLDESKFINNLYNLNEDQFIEIIEKLHKKNKDKFENNERKTLYLCFNLLTVNDSKKGNYVIAYKKLSLDIKNKALKIADEITLCQNFKTNKNIDEKDYDKYSITKYIDNGDLYLLEDFEKNIEQIKDLLTTTLPSSCKVDDNPYIFPLQRNLIFNLKNEFAEIKSMKDKNCLTEPLKAFFGRLVKIPESKYDTPIVLLDNNANMKQLLAIHNAMKNPVSYIQGPPGTGKTSTIVNTILTAFFNDKTVLFTSYNNKPIDGVAEKLSKITYDNYPPLFPMLEIKNNDKIPQALKKVRSLYETAKNKIVFKDMLIKKKRLELDKTEKINRLLEEYEKRVEIDETKIVLDKMTDKIKTMEFNLFLQGIESKNLKKREDNLGKIDYKETISLINENKRDFFMYIYFKTVDLLKKIDLSEYKDFKDILYMEKEEEQKKAFNQYLRNDENIYKLLNIFPVMLVTCISARKVGSPKQYFDLTIMDEASQCDNATALIPIIRSNKLMLVGDPQQLNPVIVLDKTDDERLKKEYNIPDVYDFMNNSVYKTFIANDFISNEILLNYHYRCTPQIIQFNNKKYYNNKLQIETKIKTENALSLLTVDRNESTIRNAAPAESEIILKYIKENKNKSIGIITPFKNQKKEIEETLRNAGVLVNDRKSNISCGTVHSFQGDEKDEVIFSLALTNKTGIGTYKWLKCNKELINVATSRGKNKLILITSPKDIERLHNEASENDDLYELYQYVKTNGTYNNIKTLDPDTRALGLKAFSSETENDFLETLDTALSNLNLDEKIVVCKEISPSSIFEEDFDNLPNYFLQSKFDFVIFKKAQKKGMSIPLFAFEVDGIEHSTNKSVIERDRKKEQICKSHNFKLIRVPNSYARRYKYIKNILEEFFENKDKKE